MNMIFPYHGPKPTKLTSQMAREYATENISHFSEMIKMAEAGNTNIRPGECAQYLLVWQAIHQKAGNWDLLDPEERSELVAEFYDELGDDEGENDTNYDGPQAA